MASVNSSSTLTEVENAYIDNASYEEDASVAKAKAFVTAARILLLKLPSEAGTRESHVRLNPEQIQKEIDRARTWLTANDSTPAVASSGRITRLGFDGCRG